MDQNLTPNASILKSCFFTLINHTSMPEPCVPTQSQVEEECVQSAGGWVVCWVERDVQLAGVTVAQCAEWLMKGL